MAQFIQYLYEYENGKKIRNLGFMKVETQMDKSVIQIYAKQLDEIKGILFQREDGSKYLASWEACEADEAMCAERPRRDVGMMPARELRCDEEMVRERESTREKEEEEVTSYIPPTSRRCEKIQRQDLSRLPRREWRLANNSFLLHGFYNYHHLLYIEEDEQTWIGVPGIFHEKEKMAANAFGFTKFIRPTDMDIDLSEDEKNTYEDFGYWCRQVSK